MKLSDAIRSYSENINLKATLNLEIKLDNGTILVKNTVSDFLIEKSNGNYHFEAMDTACEVEPSEITIIGQKTLKDSLVATKKPRLKNTPSM